MLEKLAIRWPLVSSFGPQSCPPRCSSWMRLRPRLSSRPPPKKPPEAREREGQVERASARRVPRNRGNGGGSCFGCQSPSGHSDNSNTPTTHTPIVRSTGRAPLSKTHPPNSSVPLRARRHAHCGVWEVRRLRFRKWQATDRSERSSTS